MAKQWLSIFLTVLKKLRRVGKKLNKKDLLRSNLDTKKGYCTQQLDNANELSRDIYRKINMFKDFTEPEPNCDKDEIPKIPTSVVISILWDYVESLKRINSRNMDNANHLTELVG